MEPVTRFIEENFGLSFLVGVIVVGVVISGIVWFTIWAVKLLSKHEETSSRIDTLPCATHTSKLDKYDERFSTAETLMSEMKGQLDLLVKLSTSSRTKPLLLAENDYSEKHSPRKLNQNGVILYADIKGDDFLRNNFKFFASKIDKLSPKTALDVENYALSILRASLDMDIFIPLKSWVYNEPTRTIKRADEIEYTTNVSMDDVLFVLSLPLRDKYLELHPEIIR